MVCGHFHLEILSMNRASLITIGDEILIGQVVDTNSSWLGQRLTDLGIDVCKKFTVGDEIDEIVEMLDSTSHISDIVIVTGGLGPTPDDLTIKAICRYFDIDTYYDEEAFKWIETLFAQYGRKPKESHRVQCFLPEGCTKLENKMGTAPGMLLSKNDCHFIFTPGVPMEMKYIYEHGIEPFIRGRFDLPAIYYRTVRTAGVGESVIHEHIASILEEMPQNMSVAFLPSLSQVRIRVLAKGSSSEEVHPIVESFVTQIVDKLGDCVFGMDDVTLPEAVGKLLREKGKKLTLAESCTGGNIAHMVTSIAGASDYFVGSIVSYSNDLKMSELGVSEQTLIDHGAVSEETVVQMAQGALKRYGADIALSVSGIAGPDGGTEEKPVGTIWMCVSDGNTSETRLFHLPRTREINIEQASMIGLNLIRKFLLGLELA